MKKSVLLVIAFLCLSPLSFGQGGTGGGGGGGDLAPTTVAKLPVSPMVGTVYSVKDGNSVTDCSHGGGTTGVVCLWTGSVWTAIGSAAGTGANTALSNLVSPTPNVSLVLAPGLSIGSSDTGTPKFTFGTNSITPSQPVLLPTGSTAPTQSQLDGSTKLANTLYTDTAVANAVAGVNPAIAVLVATTSASDTSGLTYANGVSGVGATFTGAVNTAITIDGVTFTAVGQRLLVKNDTQSPSGAFNGIYSLTALQTAGTGAVFTRATDYDTPSNMNSTGAIPVQSGTANTTTSWLMTAQIVTVGTTPLTFAWFSYNPANLVNASSPGAGIARFAGSTQTVTSAELSGDATTSGSNAVTVVHVNGAVVPASAAYVASNSSRQLVAAAAPFTSFAWGNSTNVAATGTTYMGSAGLNSTEIVAAASAGNSGTISHLYCSVHAAPTSTYTDTFTIRVGASSPSNGPTCQITSTNTSCSDTSNTASYTAGQLLDVQLAVSASATSPADAYCGFQLTNY